VVTRFVPLSNLDRLAAGLFETAGRPRLDRQIPMDAYQRDEELVLHFDLPGVREDDVDLQIERRTLSVRVERQSDAREGDQVIVAERPWGHMSRQVVLGDTLDTNRVSAGLEHGVLTLRIPVAANAKSRRIEINHAPISAQSSEHPVEGAEETPATSE